MNLSYKDIKFILLALELYSDILSLESTDVNKNLASNAGNNYMFVESLIKKLNDQLNSQKPSD